MVPNIRKRTMYAEIAIYPIYHEDDFSFRLLGYRAEIVGLSSYLGLERVEVLKEAQSDIFSTQRAAVEDLTKRLKAAGVEDLCTIPAEQSSAERIYDEWWSRYKKKYYGRQRVGSGARTKQKKHRK